MVQDVYSTTAGGGSDIDTAVMRAGSTKQRNQAQLTSSPCETRATIFGARSQSYPYVSSSVVAGAIEGLTSADLHRSAAETNLACINGCNSTGHSNDKAEQ